MVTQLVAKFEAIGPVRNKKSNEPRLLTGAAQISWVLGQIAIASIMSLHQATKQAGISRESVRKVLKLHKFHLYNLTKWPKRIGFCEIEINCSW